MARTTTLVTPLLIALMLTGCAGAAPTAAVLAPTNGAEAGGPKRRLQASMVEYAAMLATLNTATPGPSSTPEPSPTLAATPAPTSTPGTVTAGGLTAIATATPAPTLLVIATPTPAPTLLVIATPTPTPAPVRDTAAPLVSNVAASDARTAIAVGWSTNEAARGSVEWGANFANRIACNALATSQRVTIAGLMPGQTITFRVRAVDAAGNTTVSAPMSRRTSLW